MLCLTRAPFSLRLKIFFLSVFLIDLKKCWCCCCEKNNVKWKQFHRKQFFLQSSLKSIKTSLGFRDVCNEKKTVFTFKEYFSLESVIGSIIDNTILVWSAHIDILTSFAFKKPCEIFWFQFSSYRFCKEMAIRYW